MLYKYEIVFMIFYSVMTQMHPVSVEISGIFWNIPVELKVDRST